MTAVSGNELIRARQNICGSSTFRFTGKIEKWCRRTNATARCPAGQKRNENQRPHQSPS